MYSDSTYAVQLQHRSQSYANSIRSACEAVTDTQAAKWSVTCSTEHSRGSGTTARLQSVKNRTC